MSKTEAKFMRIFVSIGIMSGYIAGAAIGIYFDNWFVLLGAPLFSLVSPDPYKYFGKEKL